MSASRALPTPDGAHSAESDGPTKDFDSRKDHCAAGPAAEEARGPAAQTGSADAGGAAAAAAPAAGISDRGLLLKITEDTRLSHLNGQINKMDHDSLVAELQAWHLNQSGTVGVLRQRLKQHMKKQLMPKPTPVKRELEFICVLDFECTCQEDTSGYPHEVIEFPVMVLELATRKIVAEFHSFCKPTVNPILTPFCTKLTGITQAQVDDAPSFPSVIDNLSTWLEQHNLRPGVNCAFATDGPWDFRDFMSIQCHLAGMKRPRFSNKWVDIRKLCSKVLGVRGGVEFMLAQFGLKFEGRPHSGIDDTRNIARIAIELLNAGAELRVTDDIQRMDTSKHDIHKRS